jgi:hypothetical protein
LPMECECLTGCGDGVAQWNWGTPKRCPPKIEGILFLGGGVSYNHPLQFPVPAGGISLSSKSNICLIE